MMSDLIKLHGSEMADMQVKLDQSLSRENVQLEDNADLAEQIKKMIRKQNANEHLQDLLNTARENKSIADSERDDLKDKIVGMEARDKARLDRHSQEIEKMKKVQLTAEELV